MPRADADTAAPLAKRAAASGEAAAFARLVEPFRDELTAHCYRMLGSLPEAEDAVQDTLVRAWQAWDRFEERGFLRAWLVKIATNRCLTRLRQAGRRRELPGGALLDAGAGAEARWLGPYPDHRLGGGGDPAAQVIAREAIALSFVAALHHLPPRQRAALLLRDALGFSAAETAGLLDVTVPAVNSALQRARQTMARHQGTATRGNPAPDDAGTHRLAQRYAAAWEAGDVDAIVTMLADDARYAMPPRPERYLGRDAVRGFLAETAGRYRWRFVATRANGTLAFGTYLWQERESAFLPSGLDLLFVTGDTITEVISFLDADLPRFGLPASLPALPPSPPDR